MSVDTYYEITMEFPAEDNKLRTQTFCFESINEISPTYRTLKKEFLNDFLRLVSNKTYSINGIITGIKKIVNEEEVSSIPSNKIHLIVVSLKGEKKVQLGFLIAELEKFVSVIGVYPEFFYWETVEKPYLFQNIIHSLVAEPWRFNWGVYSSIKSNLDSISINPLND